MKKIFAITGGIILFVAGIGAGIFCSAVIGDTGMSPPVQDLYLIAQKKAQEECEINRGLITECASQKTTYIQDISCKNLAPQNSGIDRCGYWDFSFSSKTSSGSIRVIEVQVRYDESIKDIQQSLST